MIEENNLEPEPTEENSEIESKALAWFRDKVPDDVFKAIAVIVAAKDQIKELHSSLTEELAEQYREANRVGWLSPDQAQAMKRKIDLLEGEKNDALEKSKAANAYRKQISARLHNNNIQPTGNAAEDIKLFSELCSKSS